MPSLRLFRLVFFVSCLAFTLPLGGQSASSPDFDADGTVGFSDFVLFVQHFGAQQGDANYNATFDLDGSGDIGFPDFLSFAQTFGQKVENTLATRTEVALDAASGGTVSLSEGPEIQIPTGSLSGNATVRIERIGSVPIERKPPDALTIGDLFDVQVEGGTIIGPIGLAIPYDPTKLPSGASLSSVFAAFWDGQNWHRVPGIVDQETQQIWIETNHLSEWIGLFGQTLQIKRFSALPEKLVAPPTQVQTIDFALTADTQGLSAGELDVTLSFESQVNNTFTPSGQFTLQDDGNPQGATSKLEITTSDNNPLFDFSIHSTDPTASGDGIYGAQISLGPEPLLEQVQAIRATVTVKQQTGSGILDQREILIPIEKTQERLAIRLISPASGETVDPNPIFTWEANFFQVDTDGAPADRVTILVDDDPNIFGEFFNPSGFQRKAITVTGNNWLQIREALPQGDYYWGIEAFHDATRQTQRTQTPAQFNVSGVELYTGNLPEIDPQDHLPKITIDPLEGTQTGNITLTYTLEDEDQNANNIVFTFTSSLQSGSAHLVSTTNGTVVDPGRGRYVIQAVPPGSHSLVWNSRNGLNGKLVRDVRIHVSLGNDLDRGPRLASSSAFVVDNTQLSAPGDSTVTGLPVLSVLPSEIDVDNTPTETQVLIQNAGIGTLVWTISEGEIWMRVTSIQGNTDGNNTFAGENNVSLTVHTLGIGLPGGLYESTLKIQSTGGGLDIPVRVTVPPREAGNTDIPSGVEVTTIITPDSTQHVMVTVPAGEFIMGSDSGEVNEQPVHTVFLDAYKIDRFEVTNTQYQAFVIAAGGAASLFAQDGRYNGPNQPVLGVSWTQADAYCKWIGGRLPTEAEWEKAAQGLDARTYPWGNEAPTAELLNHNRILDRTQDVSSHPTGQSPYGVHDMAGNVWEWVSDWFNADYYANSPDRNPTGPAESPAQTSKVIRGGSWAESDPFVRSTQRFAFRFQLSNDLTGFRCTISPDTTGTN